MIYQVNVTIWFTDSFRVPFIQSCFLMSVWEQHLFSMDVHMTTFSDLRLHPQLIKALDELGYEDPTPIQAQAIPLVLDGKDVLGCGKIVAVLTSVSQSQNTILPRIWVTCHFLLLICSSLARGLICSEYFPRPVETIFHEPPSRILGGASDGQPAKRSFNEKSKKMSILPSTRTCVEFGT